MKTLRRRFTFNTAFCSSYNTNRISITYTIS